MRTSLFTKNRLLISLLLLFSTQVANINAGFLINTRGAINCQNAPPVSSTTNPNFSGVWVFDRPKSKISSDHVLYKDDLELTIEHKEPEIRILRKLKHKGKERIQEVVYYSDNRGEANPDLLNRNKVKSKTTWDNDRLVSKYTITFTVPGDVINVDGSDQWELSADGKTLIQTTRHAKVRGSGVTPLIDMVGSEVSIKVFNRVS